MELNWNHFDHYELLLDTYVTQEETRETIVPDAYPDIQDIVEAGGQLCLNEKDIRDGAASASGMVYGWLLYRPEGDETVCRIGFELPVTWKTAVPGCTEQGTCVVRPALCRVDARMLNPRKVLIRAEVSMGLQVYEPQHLSLASGLMCDGVCGVQQLTREQQAYLTTAVREKAFSVYEEVHVPAGMDRAEDMLSLSAEAWCTEAKLIGSKLIFKGEACVHTRYLTGGQVCSAAIPVAFSQLIEVDNAGEDADCSVGLCVTGIECTTAGESGRMLNITLDLLGQATVSERFTIPLLQDAYSTQGDMTAEVESNSVPRLLERYAKPQSVREVLETDMQAKSVIDAAVRVCKVRAATKNGEPVIETQLQAEVLYMDVQDQLRSISRTIIATGQIELPEGGTCRISCHCPGEAFATVVAGGLEVRCNLEFRGDMTRRLPVVTLKNVKLTERSRESRVNEPSVVLRMAAPGEGLWDIAKAYGTTIRDICQANELDEDCVPAGQLLLIPAGN